MAAAAALERIRGHQIFFTISPGDRPAVSKWLGDVKGFFSTTAAQAADASKSFSLASAKGAPGRLPPSAANNVSTLSQIGGPGPSAVGIAGPANLGKDNFMAIEDVLEGITVHHAVQLISVLGHFLEG